MADTIVYFTRHDLTPEQEQASYAIAGSDNLHTVSLKAKASLNITTNEEAREVANAILSTIPAGGTAYVFGVFPPMVREYIIMHSAQEAAADTQWNLYLFEAWNERRSVEGERPTFHFKRWCQTGAHRI